MKFDYDVFLSNNSRDKSLVLPLAERLREDGLRVSLDDWIIQPGAKRISFCHKSVCQ